MPELYIVYCSSCGDCGHAHSTLEAADACRRRHDVTSMRVFGPERSGPWRRNGYHTAEVHVVPVEVSADEIRTTWGSAD
jgi:hypothetical protein